MPAGVYLVESFTECGVLLSYLEAVTCAVGGLDTRLKHFMDTNYTVALLKLHISMRITRNLIFYNVLKSLIILEEF